MIKQAFDTLRQHGLIARPGWETKDAGSELVNRAAELRAKGACINGAVFFTKEDVAHRTPGGAYPLHFGPVPTPDGRPVGLDAEKIGEVVVKSLLANGVYCEWDGDPTHPVIVKEN